MVGAGWGVVGGADFAEPPSFCGWLRVLCNIYKGVLGLGRGGRKKLPHGVSTCRSGRPEGGS